MANLQSLNQSRRITGTVCSQILLQTSHRYASMRSLTGMQADEVGEQPLGINGNESWEDIINKTWHTYKITPLYKFSYNASALKSWSRILTAKLEAELHKTFAVLVGSDCKLLAVFSELKGLTYHEVDNEAIKVIVTVFNNGSKKETFCCILCSVDGVVQPRIDYKQHKLTSLPLLLVRGQAFCKEKVFEFLQEKFRCCISPLTFPPTELSWLASMWLNIRQEDKVNQPFELVYTTPEETLQRITYSLSYDSACQIWNRIHDSTSGTLYDYEVATFFTALHRHFLRMFGINLASLSLLQVGMPAVMVQRHGKMKIMAEIAVRQVLRHMTSLSQEITAL